jgi:hypothetical protein
MHNVSQFQASAGLTPFKALQIERLLGRAYEFAAGIELFVFNFNFREVE